MKFVNVLDCQLTDRSLILHCENDRTIFAETSNVQFLLDKWDKKGDLICEIPTWDSQDSEFANIPAVVMKRLSQATLTQAQLAGVK